MVSWERYLAESADGEMSAGHRSPVASAYRMNKATGKTISSAYRPESRNTGCHWGTL
jgi:hypothetical protein